MAIKRERRRKNGSDEKERGAQINDHPIEVQHGRRKSKHANIRQSFDYTDDAGTGRKVMFKIGRAMLARLLFVVHSMITVWQAVDVYRNTAYWGFALISVAIVMEGAYTVIVRAGDERRWFCPSVLLYVLGTAPSIWALETDMSQKRFLAWTRNGTIRAQEHELGTLKISHELWVQLLEQFLLVILIVGRWLLPKGEITREQLSQILLAYLAIASDIVELFDVFKELSVVRHRHLQNLVLGIWTISLLQFPFVLTVSKARKMRVAITKASSDEEIKRIHYRAMMRDRSSSKIFHICHDIDIWAILLANCFQDVPFLMVRLYLMLGYGTMTYTMIFFTCKNTLIIMLQGYRGFILTYDRYFKPTAEDDARILVQHYEQMLDHCKDTLMSLRGDRMSNNGDVEYGDGNDSGSGSPPNAAAAAAAPLLVPGEPVGGYKKKSPRPSPAPSTTRPLKERKHKDDGYDSEPPEPQIDNASASGLFAPQAESRKRSPRIEKDRDKKDRHGRSPRKKRGSGSNDEGVKGYTSPRKRSAAGQPRKRSDITSPRDRAASESRVRKRSSADSPKKRSKATREKPIWEEHEEGYPSGRGYEL